MTIILLIALILLVCYLYYQNQQLKANADSPAEQPDPWKEAISHLQSQIDELKKDHD